MQYTFKAMAEYIRDFKSHPFNLGILPVPLVASHLGRTPAAITAMVKAGKLRQIEIEGNKYIQTASLLERAADEAKEEEIAHDYLMKMIKNGERHTFYQPLMDELGLTTRIPAHRTKIGAILDAVSRTSFRDKKVVLSVLVHRSTQGITKPGPGFWGMAADVGIFDPATDDENEFVRKHTDKVFKVYG